MPEQLSLLSPPTGYVRRQRDAAMARVQAHAEQARKRFGEEAQAFIKFSLRVGGPLTSEQLVDACMAAGIRPHDARAFGPVFLALLRQGRIRKVGSAPRAKGHGCSGGNVWEAA